ncbi:hypothetical protein FEM48_Zijuj12G0132800 [Ziziphus jujuba var. spinosa]|uniref:Vacuolar iron transporter n=1 Tax=Ziziphus jujuba var. spinosa TaxID=714518 RepID=A0A978UDJ8_ZIZJJ|nr:hypothetical protein FEM48_Zijuj12G0132800 [Ziziphus jujuba var. spinosa]
MAGENIESTTTSLMMQREDGEEKHGRPKEPWKGEYVKSIVYAGLDAIINCFFLISSISASRSSYVLVLGFANLVADGISMGLGDYISSRIQRAVAANERAITEWKEQSLNGMSKTTGVHSSWSYYVSMKRLEWTLMMLPLPFTDSDSVKFIGACVLSGLALALLGIAKAKIAAQKYAFSVAFTLFNGTIAAAAAYTVSWTLKNVAGVED